MNFLKNVKLELDRCNKSYLWLPGLCIGCHIGNGYSDSTYRRAEKKGFIEKCGQFYKLTIDGYRSI